MLMNIMNVIVIYFLLNSIQMLIDIVLLVDGWNKMYVFLNIILFLFIICVGLFGNSIVMVMLVCWREM